MHESDTFTRRQFLSVLSALCASTFTHPTISMAGSKSPIKKPIPVSGEKLQVIGMGSARTFDVYDEETKLGLLKVLQAFFDNGGEMIDSSPMYGNAETVIGELLGKIKNKNKLFAATKVWIDGKDEGISQMQQSFKRMSVQKMDLMQIHNLRDWQVHLDTLKEWKEKGNIRYIGITTSHGRFHEELESILRSKDEFDFVQLSYNIDNRDVEKKLLPIAVDKGIAVIVNRPYQKGALFRKVKGVQLPAWANEIDCKSWGQFFLKFIVSHPAVTCCIPATTKVHHMVDNMGAGFGNLPDAEMRKKMISLYGKL